MLRSRGIRITAWIALFLLSATMVVPLWSVLATSFSTKAGSLEPGILIWPVQFSLEGYETLFNRLQFWVAHQFEFGLSPAAIMPYASRQA